jgi:hypothetical protein
MNRSLGFAYFFGHDERVAAYPRDPLTDRDIIGLSERNGGAGGSQEGGGPSCGLGGDGAERYLCVTGELGSRSLNRCTLDASDGDVSSPDGL